MTTKENIYESKSLIGLDGCCVQYGEALAIDDVTFSITKGKKIAVVGPNGGGKTTLILTILGLLKFRKGSVQLYGQSSPSNSTLTKLGWVSQHASNIPKNIKLTVKELVQLGTLNTSNVFWRYNLIF